MRFKIGTACILLSALAAGCADQGQPGLPGAKGDPGPTGDPGTPANKTGAIHGTVKDPQGNPIAGVAVGTDPVSMTVTSDQAGAFALESIAIGSYTVTAMKAGFAAFRLPSVGVAASVTTSVSLTLTIGPDTPGTISGVVTD